MEDIKFFKTVIYSIINLLGYLLSIFFLSSLYYIKILSFYFNNDDEKEILNNLLIFLLIIKLIYIIGIRLE